ncbi:PREDICTED: uncharacterized protein LOC106101327 [Papilio polytes]|uniref:uncharacterized protein LOC106101327 n=1 Tax=Papilio polytes TaxID=76194 RepID=UPI0006768BA8|nr:PREDICTED: uncharacterized protein LOC106101327 [Papilio polytes]
MPGCALRHCKTRYDSGPRFSLFSFPPTRNEVFEKWIQFVRKERHEIHWFPSSASKLCSKHFRMGDMHFGVSGRRILRRGSVPCEFQNDDKEDIKNQIEFVEVPDGCIEMKPNKEKIETEVTLKAQVCLLEKRKIIHINKIRKLSQQNRYFKRRLLELKDLVSFYKKRYKMDSNVSSNVQN